MDGSMFISRHDLSFQFIFCDARTVNLIGYEPSDLLGRTAYQFHCPRDVLICMQCHKQLIVVGSSTSGYYRFLARTGAWVWLYTYATVVYDTARNPQYIVCRNHVVSAEEAERQLSREKKDFERMKCLGFSLDTELPVPEPPNPASSHTLAHFAHRVVAPTSKMLDTIFSHPPADIANNNYQKNRKRWRAMRSGEADSLPEPASPSSPALKKSAASPFGFFPTSSLNSVGVGECITFEHPLGVTSSVSRAPAPISHASALNDHGESHFDAVTASITNLFGISLPATAGGDVNEATPIDTVPSLSVGFSTPSDSQTLPERSAGSGCMGSLPPMPTSQYNGCAANDSTSCGSSQVATVPFFSGDYSSVQSVSMEISMTNPAMAVSSGFLSGSFPVSNQSQDFMLHDAMGISDSLDGLLTSPSVQLSGSSGPDPPTNPPVQVPAPHKQLPMFNSIENFFSILNSPADGSVDSTTSDLHDALTSGHSDPFLTDISAGYLQDMDLMEEDLTSAPMTLTLDPTPMVSASHSQPLNKQSFGMEISGSPNPAPKHGAPFGMEDISDPATPAPRHGTPFTNQMPDLDSLFNSIPSENSGDSGLLEERQTEVHARLEGGQLSPGSSSDSDSSGKQSLLRSLLDKETSVPAGPLTYKEWILKQSFVKQKEGNKSKRPEQVPGRTGGSKKPRTVRSGVRKSIELPLPRSSSNLKGQNVEVRKPTKELPFIPPSVQNTCASDARKSGSYENGLGKVVTSSAPQACPRSDPLTPGSSDLDDLGLPEDLLDLAVEYGSTLGSDQTEALISELNAAANWEENFSAFMDSTFTSKSPAQPCPSPAAHLSSTQNSQPPTATHHQHRGKSFNPPSSAEVPPNRAVTKEFNVKGPMTCPNPHPNPHHSNLRQSLSETLGPKSSGQKKSISTLSTGKPTMSLLRAAVTSPDMDSLIQKIPFGKSKPLPLPMSKSQPAGPPGHKGDSTASKVFKFPSQSLGKPSPGKSSDSVALSKSVGVPPSSPGRPPALPPLCLPRHRNSTTSPKGPRLSKASPPSSRRSSKTLLPSAPLRASLSSPVSPRSAGSTQSDLSSTEPVSVMIMRKENHRSRRSKTIAIQTENKADEVYPEFERSPSDTVLYGTPSSSSSLPSTPSSAELSSPSTPGLSELERCLRGPPSVEDNGVFTEEPSCPSVPFLQMLLTGELSRDRYQMLDQQLLERERRQSLSSGSEHEQDGKL